MRRRFPLAAMLGALAFAGCAVDDGAATDGPAATGGQKADEPGIGEPAGLDVAGTDRIEIREGGDAWPTPQSPESWDAADVVAELTDAAEVEILVAVLADARLIDVGAVDYGLAPPTFQVGFFEGDVLTERLGYYDIVSSWGEFQVDGRWVTDDWELLAVTQTLPPID